MDSIGLVAQCTSCKHYLGGRNCAAFPDPDNESGMIPLPIFDDQFDHRQPDPGDHGIRWEPKAPGVRHPLDER